LFSFNYNAFSCCSKIIGFRCSLVRINAQCNEYFKDLNQCCFKIAAFFKITSRRRIVSSNDYAGSSILHTQSFYCSCCKIVYLIKFPVFCSCSRSSSLRLCERQKEVQNEDIDFSISFISACSAGCFCYCCELFGIVACSSRRKEISYSINNFGITIAFFQEDDDVEIFCIIIESTCQNTLVAALLPAQMKQND